MTSCSADRTTLGSEAAGGGDDGTDRRREGELVLEHGPLI